MKTTVFYYIFYENYLLIIILIHPSIYLKRERWAKSYSKYISILFCRYNRNLWFIFFSIFLLLFFTTSMKWFKKLQLSVWKISKCEYEKINRLIWMNLFGWLIIWIKYELNENEVLWGCTEFSKLKRIYKKKKM